MTNLEELKTKNFLHISQIRLGSVDKIPGKAFQEAKSWAKIFHHTVFLCFSENQKAHYKKINDKLVVIALPFDLSIGLFKTLKNLFANYIQLIGTIIKIIKKFKIDLIREENLIIAGIPAFIAAMVTRTPYITWLGGFERKVLSMKYQHGVIIPLLENAIIIFEYVIFRFARIVVTVSPELSQLIEKRKQGGGYLSPNFVDFSIFPEKDFNVRAKYGKVIFLYSGRFELEKGINTLLKAVQNLSKTKDNFELRLAGWGKEEPHMRDFVQRSGLDGVVKFIGKFSQEQLSEVYQNSDVLIIPSYDEGLPVALLEAMHSGCACICTSVGMIPKYVTNNQNGLLIAPYDENALAHAMQTYIQNPHTIIDFGRKNHAIVATASKNYMQIHSKIYTYIINQSKE